MKTDIFNSALEKLNDLTNQCEEQKQKIQVVGGFQNLTVADANKLINDSRNLKIKMDQFLTADLYHIIGMGNLSAVQIQVFCNAVKRLCSLRNLIQQLCTMCNISSCTESVLTYKCKIVRLALKSNGEASIIKEQPNQGGGKDDAKD